MKPYILNLTEEEKQELQQIAMSLGFSMEELINFALGEMLEEDSTGVYDAHE